jgi:hypothetical protein
MSSSSRRRRLLVASPLILVLALAAAWSGFWFYAVSHAEGILAEWRARELRAGRSYACGRQTIGGFPFRFELACNEASADFTTNEPKVAFKAARFQVAAQVYDPNLLIAEIDAPLTIAITGEAPVAANWTVLQISVRGRPPTPERVSMVVDGATIRRDAGETREALLRAKRIELHGRVASGSVTNRPVLDIAATLNEFTAPTLHPMLHQPIEASGTGVLRGLADLRPMPIPARLRQLQRAGGRLEIKQARVRQGDLTAVAAGSFGLTAGGLLEGELSVTVAGIERVLPMLGIDKLISQGGRRDRDGRAVADRETGRAGRAQGVGAAAAFRRRCGVSRSAADRRGCAFVLTVGLALASYALSLMTTSSSGATSATCCSSVQTKSVMPVSSRHSSAVAAIL